jgi:hypothetical protein
MEDFNNKILDSWNSYIPATSSYKMKQVLLFTLLDSYMTTCLYNEQFNSDENITDEEFIYGIKSILTEE